MANLTIELSEHEVMGAMKHGLDMPAGYEVHEIKWRFGTKPYAGAYDPRESNTVTCLNGATVTLRKIGQGLQR